MITGGDPAIRDSLYSRKVTDICKNAAARIISFYPGETIVMHQVHGNPVLVDCGPLKRHNQNHLTSRSTVCSIRFIRIRECDSADILLLREGNVRGKTGRYE